MRSISNILQSLYQLKWEGLNILECGANQLGEETCSLEKTNNCWYIEANPADYEILKTNRKNTLNFALSDKVGTIAFNVSSHAGNSSCEYSQQHLNELKGYGASITQIVVESISYEALLNRLDMIFDIVVLDIEGHEKVVLQSWQSLAVELLPTIVAIECGYDWTERYSILKDLGYKADCYFYNNCFLSKASVNPVNKVADEYNKQWKQFVYNGMIIYNNDLLSF